MVQTGDVTGSGPTETTLPSSDRFSSPSILALRREAPVDPVRDRLVEVGDDLHLAQVGQVEQFLLLADLDPGFEPGGALPPGVHRVDQEAVVRGPDGAAVDHLLVMFQPFLEPATR